MNKPLIPFLLLFAALSMSAQEKVRTIQQRYKAPNPPIEIVGWETNGKPFFSESQVKADSEWWKNLTLTVRNKTEKGITDVSMQLSIEKQGQMPSAIGMLLMVEPREDASLAGKNPRWFGPGETAKLKVRDFEPVQWSERLKEWGVTDIDHLLVYISSVYFDDGTGWVHGQDTRFPSSHSPDLSQKKIEKVWNGGNEPVEIVSIRANGKLTELNKVFRSEGDWLKDLKLNFRNISDRPVKRVVFYLTVLENKPIGPPTSWPAELNAASLGVGNTLEVAFEPNDGLRKAFDSRYDLTLRNTAQTRIVEVDFVDGTKWEYGSYYKPDPDNPVNYLIDRERSQLHPMR